MLPVHFRFRGVLNGNTKIDTKVIAASVSRLTLSAYFPKRQRIRDFLAIDTPRAGIPTQAAINNKASLHGRPCIGSVSASHGITVRS